MNFANALLDDGLRDPKICFLDAYGLYLANGGTPDGFLDMTEDDVGIMYNSYMALQKNNNKEILDGIVNIINKMFGGK